jgi:S-DNA-T family DNA segregation ATPase FtsK/SpoIIIE
VREKLQFQADRIEAVLAVHKAPARVTGGTVTPRWVRFQVLPDLGTRISRIKNLAEELAAALDSSSCRISRRGAAVTIEVPRDDPRPVRLLPLIHQLTSDKNHTAIPSGTAILGLSEDGSPLLIRLPSTDVAHVLVAGTTGSGKTTLMQCMVLSLALTNRSASSPDSAGQDGGLALVLIDPKGYAFGAFEGLPHLARSVIHEVEETAEALHSLVRLMERRGPGVRSPAASHPALAPAGRGVYGIEMLQRWETPRVVVVLDELADVLMTGGKAVQWALTRLTQRGREAGIDVIAATQKPTSAVLGPLVKANFPVRLVGRVTSIEDARTATGWGGTGAERLLGRGDFLAVAEGRVTRFQAAHVSAKEIRGTVARLSKGVSASALQRRDQAKRCGPHALTWCDEDPSTFRLSCESSPALAPSRAGLPWPVGGTAEVFGGETGHG